MPAEAQIIEMDQERDRKTCLTLDLKITGANRELAQWCFDHPRYGQRTIAEWLGCSPSRIFQLRRWAAAGFAGSPFDSNNKPDDRVRHDVVTPRNHAALETSDNSTSDEPDDAEMAAPEQIEENVLYVIARINENARAITKILRASTMDRDGAEKINTAIERMIQKWRSIQSSLAKKKESK